MPGSNCPDLDRLAAYAQGHLDEPTADVVADHLAQCDACEATVCKLEQSGDTLAIRLRNLPPEDPIFAEPPCAEAVRQAQQADGGQADNSVGDPPTAGRSPPTPTPLPQLRDYQLLEELGSGGMGTVFKARHTKLKKTVAVKVLAASRMQDPRAVARFEREMEAIGQLDHPHLVRALDAGEFQGTHFLVMEFVPGIDLSRMAALLGPLFVSDACELIRQAAVGLQAVHEHGLVHRDIKPANLMLWSGESARREQGTGSAEQPSAPAPQRTPLVKILDLGLALLDERTEEASGLTHSGQIMGTADYMAPEQAVDTHGADIRADIYSLGCTLYRLLCGRAPFSGPGYKSTSQKIIGHARDAAASVSSFRSDIPEKLAHILAQMMAKEPAQRFATPAEVTNALAPFCVGADLRQLLRPSTGTPPPAFPNTATFEHLSSAHTETTPDEVVTHPKAAHYFPPRWRIFVGVLLAVLLPVVFWAVLIRIRHPEGKETTVQVPKGSKVEVSPEGDVKVALANGDRKTPGPPAPHSVSPLPPEAKQDLTVDLLPLVDPSRDAVKGVWTRTADGLKSDGSVPFCRIVLPYEPPVEYDFRIAFTAKGGNDVLQLLSAGERSFSFLMGGWGGRFDGFDAVQGHPFVRDGQNIIGGPSSVQRGQRHIATIQVRKNLVRAVVDDKQVVEHLTDAADLSMPVEWTIRPGRLGLGTTFDETEFHRIEVVEITGRGKVIQK